MRDGLTKATILAGAVGVALVFGSFFFVMLLPTTFGVGQLGPPNAITGIGMILFIGAVFVAGLRLLIKVLTDAD